MVWSGSIWYGMVLYGTSQTEAKRQQLERNTNSDKAH
jgi:hypothetical protein